MSKRILFFDDDKMRHRGFSMMNIGCNIDHVYNAKDCIQAMKNNPRYDLFSLDHDMDLNDTNQDETGTLVAEYIRLHLMKDKYPSRVIIHSYNKDAAMHMRNLIADTGLYVTCEPYRGPYINFETNEEMDGN